LRTDPRPTSQIGGILEVGGGVRTVVTQDWRFRFHVGDGERLFVVPGVWLFEPIPFDMWPWVVGKAEIHVATMLWPKRLERWGVWEAKEFFNRNVNRLVHDRSLSIQRSDLALVEAGRLD